MLIDSLDLPKEVLIDPEMAFGVRFGSLRNLNVFCPFHEEEATSRTKSCSVSTEGIFKCHACGKTGMALEFYAAMQKLSLEEAKARVQARQTRTQLRETRAQLNDAPKGKLSPRLPEKCMQALREPDRAKFLKYLLEGRGLTEATLTQYRIGCDEFRVTIPITDENGVLLNVRRYLPEASAHGVPKMVSHRSGDGSPVLYPLGHDDLSALPDDTEVIICEGEWDCLLLRQYGFLAFTNTGNCKVWRAEWTEKFKRFRITIIYDVNDEGSLTLEPLLGQRMARERAQEFRAAGCKHVRVVDLPLSMRGGDITNWFVDMQRTAQELRTLIDSVPYASSDSPPSAMTDTGPAAPKQPDTSMHTNNGAPPVPPDQSTPGTLAGDDEPKKPSSSVELVTLHDAAGSQYYFKPIRLRCLVAGKASAPYLVPGKVRATVHYKDGTRDVIEDEFTPWDGRILSLVRCSQAEQKRALRTFLGVDPDSPFTVEFVTTFNLQEVFLIPAVDHAQDQGPYVLRQCYYAAHSIATNRVYDFIGYTLPDPHSQLATHVLVHAEPAETSIESFKLTPARYTKLAETFQTTDPHAKMIDIASELAGHVTHIYGRTDLHIAADLVFHSPLAFNFDGVEVRKGWLEALILGDTRTGKGFVTEGLCRYYGLGEVVSGENLTMAGLVGAVQHVGERWTLVWGKLPLADKRLVIIDECNSLTHGEISRLSRIRSEGVAEITKAVSEKTTARTRLIWNGNPRPVQGTTPRMISDYNFGIEAVPELIGAAEDLARFDFVLIVAQSDVPADMINKHHDAVTNAKYTANLCKDLILWAWSRTAAQVIFDTGVTELAMAAAKSLGSLLSPKIPLAQAADVRFKLARIACAIAARTFSTTDGVHLLVRREHMEFAYNFLHHIYSKPCCGYLQFSAAEREQEMLRNPLEVAEILDQAGPHLPDLISGLLQHRAVTARDLCDYAAIDIHQARTLISELVRARALVKEYNYYTKKPAFKTFLHQLKAKLFTEQNTTQESNDEQDN